MARSPNQRTLHLLDTLNAPVQKNTFKTSRGVVFKLNKVSPYILQDLDRKMRARVPKPPVVYIEDKEREEENPNDPDYLKAVQEFNMERGMLSLAVYVSMGTEVQTIPAGMEPVESDEWSNELRRFGLDIADKGRERYFQWVKYYAVSDADELNELLITVMGVTGEVFEEAVKEAEESFRRKPEGDTAERVPVEQEG